MTEKEIISDDIKRRAERFSKGMKIGMKIGINWSKCSTLAFCHIHHQVTINLTPIITEIKHKINET